MLVIDINIENISRNISRKKEKFIKNVSRRRMSMKMNISSNIYNANKKC
jgi:hypothetical protein